MFYRKIRTLVWLCLACSLAIGAFGCGDDGSADDAGGFFSGLEEPNTSAVTPRTTEVECQGECPTDGLTEDGNYDCTYRHWENVEVFDSFSVFQPDLDRLYPGAIFKGGVYVDNGYLEEIVFPEGVRTGIEASFSMENTTESPTISMSSPSLSSYREERNRVLSGQHGTNPTAVELSMQQVYSEAHFNAAAGAALALGVGGGIGGVAGLFAAAFERKSETKQSMFLLRLSQQNYQVNLASKVKPGDYFSAEMQGPSAKPGLSEYIDDGFMPIIVSDLFYGRLVLCAVSTYSSAQETREAWMTAVAGGLIAEGVGVGGAAAAALTEEQRQILSESSVECFINGGAGSDAVKAVRGVDGIVEAILGSGDQSAKTPGGLIGYRLMTLTNRELPISLTTNYTSEECLKASGHLTMELDRIQLHGQSQSGNTQMFGKIGVTYPEPGGKLTDCTAAGGTGGTTVMLFDRPRDQAIEVRNNFMVDLGTQSTAEVNIQADSKICVFGNLMDQGDILFGLFPKDESLGEGWALVDVNQWNGEFGLNLTNAIAHFRFDLSL